MKRKYLLLFLPLLFFLFFFPEESLLASCEGVRLWFHTVLPALLPFLILSNILVRSGLILPLLSHLDPVWNRLLGLTSGGAYCLALGVLCGFPMGARLSAELLRQGQISREEAVYLLCFSNNASPMFLTGFVAAGSLKNPGLTAPLLLIYYSGLLLTVLICRIRFRRFHVRSGQRAGSPKRSRAPHAALHSVSYEGRSGTLKAPKKETPHPLSLGELMDVSIMDGFDVILRLGGYIILFTIYSAMLAKLCAFAPALHPAAAMLLEITTGTGAVLASGWEPGFQFAFLLSGIAFGGLSTLAQTSGMIRGSGLKLGTYFRAKLLQGLLTFAAAYFWLFFVV